MIVPQAASGISDIVGRLVGQKLGGSVVESRSGASGNIDSHATAKDLRDWLEQQGVELAGTLERPVTPDQLAALLQEDIAKWARIVKSSGASVD